MSAKIKKMKNAQMNEKTRSLTGDFLFDMLLNNQIKHFIISVSPTFSLFVLL